jgi:hypothetical protein
MEVEGVEELKRVIELQRSPKPKKKKVPYPKSIPENVTLDEILKSLPKEVSNLFISPLMVRSRVTCPFYGLAHTSVDSW